jgi:hypothetical protein
VRVIAAAIVINSESNRVICIAAAAAIVISSDNTEKVDPLEIGNDHGKTASSRCRGFNFLK